LPPNSSSPRKRKKRRKRLNAWRIRKGEKRYLALVLISPKGVREGFSLVLFERESCCVADGAEEEKEKEGLRAHEFGTQGEKKSLVFFTAKGNEERA